tara:strand:- start:39 stop:539 length:501 start_codon:yes stop_codon:yes gene_type:complete
MPIVSKSDFRGEYSISKTSYDQLDWYIEKYEKKYLQKIFGAELYRLFKADLTVTDPQVPQAPRFLDIFEPFAIDSDSLLVESEGIRKMLVGFIYFHYVRELQTENSASGTVTNSVELGINAKYNGNIITAFNDSVDISHSIQWFIYEKKDEYPEENIQLIENISGI